MLNFFYLFVMLLIILYFDRGPAAAAHQFIARKVAGASVAMDTGCGECTHRETDPENPLSTLR